MLKTLLLLTTLLSAVFGATVWRIQVGGQGDIDPNLFVGQDQYFWFYPSTLTVNQGDTVVFQWGSPMAYAVTFASSSPSLLLVSKTGRFYFNPQIAFPSASNVVTDTSAIYTSGVAYFSPITGNPSWNATFPVVGTFPFWSVFANGMNGKIIVQPAGTPYPTDQATIDAQTAAQIAQQKLWWPNAKRFHNLDRTVPFSKPHPNGVNTIWSVWVGYGDLWNRYGVNLFFPNKIDVKVGDVVVFNNADIGAHTLGINSTNSFTEDILYDPLTNQLYFDPAWTTVTTTPNTGGWSGGGFMLPPVVPGNTGWTWNVTMNAPGTYHVLCSLHEGMGMRATLTVS